MASTKKQPPSDRTDSDAGPTADSDIATYKADLWRANRDLSPEDIARVADAYHAWRGKEGPKTSATASAAHLQKPGLDAYADVPGFCKRASIVRGNLVVFNIKGNRYRLRI